MVIAPFLFVAHHRTGGDGGLFLKPGLAA